jgi:hypothetical protein
MDTLGNVEKSTKIHFGALALFGVWGNFTLLLGKVPSAGIYIIMITGVTIELLKANHVPDFLGTSGKTSDFKFPARKSRKYPENSVEYRRVAWSSLE